MVDVVGLDFNGTLLNDAWNSFYADNLILMAHGKDPVSYERWRQSPAPNAASFARLYGIDGDPVELHKEYVRNYERSARERPPQLHPDAVETLRYLRDRYAKLAVVSALREEKLIVGLEVFGIKDYFNFIMGGQGDKQLGLLRVCTVFKKQPSQVAYVSDASSDMRASRRLGVRTVAFCNGYEDRETIALAHPDRYIDALTELTDGALNL